MTTKIDAWTKGSEKGFTYSNTYAREPTTGPERLCVGVADEQGRCVLHLAQTLSGPFKFLYVLHTTRTGATVGRYEGPAMNLKSVEEFLSRFGRFLNEDARHDIWLHSRDENATIVLDRHNLIYAYGPLDDFERVLESQGVMQGPRLVVPEPHVHHYHSEWDHSERAILDALPWEMTPLRDSDIQVESSAGAG